MQDYNLTFGERLITVFKKIELTDPAQIGWLVADAQENPYRETPYTIREVNDWLMDEALPSEPAFNAILDMSEDRLLPEERKVLIAAYQYEISKSHLPKSRSTSLNPTKNRSMIWPDLSGLSNTVKERQNACGLKGAEVAAALTRNGYRTSSGNELTEGAYAIALHRNHISESFAAACDKIFANHAQAEPSLLAMRQQIQLDFAETFWNENHFGSMLLACRMRLGLTRPQLIEALVANGAKPISNTGMFLWESGENLPSYKQFPQSDVVTAYATLMVEADAKLSPPLMPWWTPERESQMRDLYTSLRTSKTASAATETAAKPGRPR